MSKVCPDCFGEGEVTSPDGEWIVLCMRCGGSGAVLGDDDDSED